VPPATTASISVDVRYAATAALQLDLGTWELLLADGSEVPLTATDADAGPITLAAGQKRDVHLDADFAAADDSPFIAYVDRTTGDIVFLVAVD
jgi:hypothetical protein